MMKTDVYSWRVASETRSELEREARREGASIAEILDRITGQWLAARRAERAGEDAEQARMRQAAVRTFGSISGGDPRRSVSVRDEVRRRLQKRRGR